MNGNKKNFIVVHIKAVEGQEKNFLAFLQSEVLKSTFFLFFNDDIMGAIALNHFANMLSKEYAVDVKLQLVDEKAKFHDKALLDIVMQKVLYNPLLKN